MHLKNYRHFSYFIIPWQIRIHKLNNKRLPQLPYSRFSNVIWGKKWNTPKQSSRWKYENQSVAIFTPCKVATELFNKRNALLSLKTFWKIYDNKWHCIITRKKLAKHYFEHTLQIKFHTVLCCYITLAMKASIIYTSHSSNHFITTLLTLLSGFN